MRRSSRCWRYREEQPGALRKLVDTAFARWRERPLRENAFRSGAGANGDQHDGAATTRGAKKIRPRLPPGLVDEIAEKAAEKAISKMTDHVYPGNRARHRQQDHVVSRRGRGRAVFHKSQERCYEMIQFMRGTLFSWAGVTASFKAIFGAR